MIDVLSIIAVFIAVVVLILAVFFYIKEKDEIGYFLFKVVLFCIFYALYFRGIILIIKWSKGLS